MEKFVNRVEFPDFQWMRGKWKIQLTMKNDLILLYKRNLEGYRGYEYAAENIKNQNFKNFLEAYARKRKHFAEELEEIMSAQDINPHSETTVLGDVHSGFMKIVQSINPLSDKELLRECARGESVALSDYEKILKNERFIPSVLSTLMKHRDTIMAAERTMRELAPVLEDDKS